MAITWLSFAAGVLLGGVLAALWMRIRIAELNAAKRTAEAATEKMGQTFQALADAALRSSQSAFLDAAKSALETVRAEMRGDLSQRHTAIEGVVRPLSDSLARLDSQVRSLEADRQKAFGSLAQQLSQLSKETLNLSTALRSPQARGRWGEITLRRVAELAGMVSQCDFYEQETLEAESGRIRPDMVVRLPGDRRIVVDAKVPLTAYLDAVAATAEATIKLALQSHARQVANHVSQLAAKQYWTQFQPAPELVVLFIPGEHFLNAALEINPTLIESALDQKIMLATPQTLIAILQGIAHGWRQEQLAANAEEIRRVASELYERLQAVHAHYDDAGRALEKAVESYNRSVGSWENRLLPSLRRIRELGAASGDEPQAPQPIAVTVRTPKAVTQSGGC